MGVDKPYTRPKNPTKKRKHPSSSDPYHRVLVKIYPFFPGGLAPHSTKLS